MITFAEFLTESGATTAVSGHANEHFATSFINDYVSSMNNHMSNGASEDEAHERAIEEMNDRQYKHEDWKDHSGLEKAHKIFDKEEMSKMHDDSKETTQEIINFLKNKYDMTVTRGHHMGIDGPAGAERLTGKRTEADMIVEGRSKKGERQMAQAFTEYLGASLKYSKAAGNTLKIFSPGINTMASIIDKHESDMGIGTNLSLADELEQIKNEGISKQREALAEHHDILQDYFSKKDAEKQAKSKRKINPSYTPEYDSNGNVIGAQMSQAAVSHIRDSKIPELRAAYESMSSKNLEMKTKLADAIHNRISNIINYQHPDPEKNKQVKESLFRSVTNLYKDKLPTFLVSTTRGKGARTYDLSEHMNNIIKSSGVPETSKQKGTSTFKFGDFSFGLDSRPTTGGTSGDANPLSGPINVSASTAQIKKLAEAQQKQTQKPPKPEDEAGSNQHGGSNFHSKDELKEAFVNENTQLNEATTDTKQGKQTHLEHIEDLAYDGHEGVGLADQHLRQMHNYLLGARRNTPDRVETKVDGAPAFHVFKDNEGRIGVGTKSMFNKNPKLNFTEEDIDANHGHAPGLAAVLKQVLAHAHKMVPSDMKPGEIYKGDFLFGDGSSGRGRETTDEFHEFQPNTLRYKVPLDSPEGAKVGNAKVGVALHTYFGTDGVAGPIDRKRRAKLLDHPDVYNYDPTVNVNPVNYTPMEQRQFEEHMENARKAYSKIKPEVYDQLVGHDQHMRTYTNQRVRAGAEGPGNVDEYLDFLNQRAQKDINSVKTQAAKDRKTKQHAALMQQVVQNAKHVQNIFDMHNHLQNAKNVLIGVSGKNSTEAVELPDGSPTGHEGYVSTIKTGDGGQHQGKFVRRDEFSLANFAQGSFQKPVQESLEEGIVDRLKGMFKSFRGNKSQNHHLVWGRMNPIHAGHEMVMKAAAEAANRDNGNVSLVLTGTQDKTKNPLSAEQKLKHARRAFPGIDVSVADKSNPTILHQAAKLYNNGVKNLTVHVGSDRVGQFSKLLNDYNGVNGKGHGYYQFHNINVVPVGGERDEDAGGVAGASATKMREAAANNDRESFHSMAPSTMKPEHVDEMMQDVQNGMTRKEELSAYFINRFKTLRG